MTSHPPQGSVALDEFVQDLLQFTHACGSPSQRELAKLAPTVIKRHKARISVLRPLSVAVISDVMSRKRLGPPPWGWVATYVLTCLHYVETTGVQPVFEGPTDLQGWHVHYQSMRDRLDRLSAASPSALQLDAGDLVLPPSATVGGFVESVLQDTRTDHGEGEWPSASAPTLGSDSMEMGRDLRWMHLDDDALQSWVHGLRNRQSMAHRRHYDLFGQHGVDLLIAAEHGDAEASFRLGILLLCYDRPAEARAWLVSAATSGDEAAQVLISAAPSRRKQMAAELAYEFTVPGYTQDRAGGPDIASPTGAEVYYRAATSAGHLGATVRMGLIYEARGELTAALHTFAQAAGRCHTDALDHFARLNNQLAQETEDPRM